ncbi:MAG TPA: FprA family A-type flavoprotein, partial [Clostridia bacterium]|nr:FprA family A-type flavoprotein [Clostridia bacterium]
MRTEWGTTYNSYLIKGSEKIALIELVKEPFTEDYIKNIRQLVDPKEIDYIVLNHTEPDHSGALRDFLKEAVNARVVGSRIALNLAREIANCDFSSMAVKDGDFIDLGNKTLKFISAPFLHWPDSMFTYLEEDGILFSGDVFGAHYCP